jgi:outer membrane protein OmpA-like peptidoglycan-associated protein
MGSEGDFAVNAVTSEGASHEIAGQARNDASRAVVIAGSDPQSAVNSPFGKRGGSEADGDFAVASEGSVKRQIAGQARNDAVGVRSDDQRQIAGQARNDASFGTRNDAVGTVSLLTNSVWSELTTSRLEINHQQNSLLGNTLNASYGLRAGTLIVVSNYASMGIFVNANNSLIEQEKNNRAIQNTIEAGIYAGVFKESVDMKFHLSLGQHDFSVRRNVFLINEYKPVSEFSAQSVKFGAQANLNKKAYEQIYFKPYIGFQMSVLNSGRIKENSGQEANLSVVAKTYTSLTGLMGLKFENLKDDLSWYVKADLGYLLIGNYEQSQFEMSFLNTGSGKSAAMRVRGLEINPLTLGISGGIEMPIDDRFNFYADMQYSRNVNITYMQASVGVKMMFNPSKQMKSYHAKLASARKAQAKKERELKRKELEKQKKIQAQKQAQKLWQAEQRETQKRRQQELERKQKQQAQERRKAAQKSFRVKAASFGANSAQLSPNAKSNIKKMAKEIKGMTYKFVTVEGHSDSSGSEKRNLQLSKSRAIAVANELSNAGIPKEKIRYISLSSQIPIATNKTPEGRTQNRRAEIFVE